MVTARMSRDRRAPVARTRKWATVHIPKTRKATALPIEAIAFSANPMARLPCRAT